MIQNIQLVNDEKLFNNLL